MLRVTPGWHFAILRDLFVNGHVIHGERQSMHLNEIENVTPVHFSVGGGLECRVEERFSICVNVSLYHSFL